jgi:hypothetical protein
VVSYTPLFKAILAIELFSHNFTIALAKPWVVCFILTPISKDEINIT